MTDVSTPSLSTKALLPAPLLTRSRAARIAGVAYLLIYALAIFANFFVNERLVVPGDGIATLANLQQSPGLARAGFIAFLAISIADLVVAWALHIVFRSTHPDLARLAAWARLVYAALLGAGLVFYLEALRLTGGGEYLTAFGSERTAAQVSLAMATFDDTWKIGLAIFGVHLALVAVLVVRSGLAPRAMGWLLAFAGLAYTTDTLLRVALPDYSQVAAVMLILVAVPSMVGEGWMALWLLRCKRLND